MCNSVFASNQLDLGELEGLLALYMSERSCDVRLPRADGKLCRL